VCGFFDKVWFRQVLSRDQILYKPGFCRSFVGSNSKRDQALGSSYSGLDRRHLQRYRSCVDTLKIPRNLPCLPTVCLPRHVAINCSTRQVGALAQYAYQSLVLYANHGVGHCSAHGKYASHLGILSRPCSTNDSAP